MHDSTIARFNKSIQLFNSSTIQQKNTFTISRFPCSEKLHRSSVTGHLSLIYSTIIPPYPFFSYIHLKIQGMELRSGIFRLPMKHRFGIARSSHDVQRTFIVALSLDGQTGYGEATENAYYNVTVEQLAQAAEDLKPFLARYRFEHPDRLWQDLLPRLDNRRFLLAAIDEAAWDLFGKLNGIRPVDYWQLDRNRVPVSSYTIGLDDVEVMAAKIREQPWPVYKIKLGTDHDKEIIRRLRRETEAPFRIDANAAWTPEQALDMARFLAEMNVEFIEQPLPAGAWKDMERIKPLSPLPLVADESCRTEKDLSRCLDAFHGINVKLTKAGGLTPGKQMLEAALRARRHTMVGCMTESTVGISAAAQLAPLCHFADLDGPLLIARDLARGVEIVPRGIRYPDVPGNGVVFEEKL